MIESCIRAIPTGVEIHVSASDLPILSLPQMIERTAPPFHPYFKDQEMLA
jgi:hypothetical protein